MNQAKPYLIGAGIAAGLYLAWRIARGKRTDAADKLPVTGEPTKPANWYVVSADALELAMFDIGTNTGPIYSIFGDLENNADFEALFNAFGVRTYTGGLIPTPWLAGNLVQWLNEELSQGQLNQVNEIMAQNGLTLRI